MKHASLFSGIGGFDLAAKWMGWENVFHCEKDKFCQKVLKYHFKNSILHEDIKTTDFTVYRGKCDILTGGFPCQDISIAGKKKGLNGERSGLFFEYIRAVDEIRPRITIWENVGEVRKYLHTISDSFSEIGYCLSWHSICASWFGFPHKRERVFGIAFDTNSFGWDEIKFQSKLIEKQIYEASKRESYRTNSWKIQLTNYDEFCRMDDGISKELHKESIKSLGNAVVPQLVLQIFKAIEKFNKTI